MEGTGFPGTQPAPTGQGYLATLLPGAARPDGWLEERPKNMDCSPAAAAEHLGHVRGWWGCSHGAAVDLEAEGRCLWASPLTAVFSH